MEYHTMNGEKKSHIKRVRERERLCRTGGKMMFMGTDHLYMKCFTLCSAFIQLMCIYIFVSFQPSTINIAVPLPCLFTTYLHGL